MKHYAMQTSLTLGEYSTRSKTRGKIRRNLAKSRNEGLKHVADNQVDWVLKHEPMLAFTVMVQGQS